MIYSRRANIYDLVSLSDCNLVNVIENYQMKYYFYHLLSWPHLTNITTNNRGRVCGYSMSKLEEDKNKSGHVTAVGVLRSFRNLGIATKVIKQTHNAMNKVYDCDCTYLYVRVTNWAAYSLYKYLGYFVDEVSKEYFHDKEDAYSMKLIFKNNL